MTHSAFTKLYTDHQTQLLNCARLRCGDNIAAEDIVQHVFLQIWEKQIQLQEIKNWKAYLFVLVRNKSADFLRRQQLHKKLLDGYTKRFVTHTNHDALLQKEYHHALQKAIEKLPPQQQLVFELRCVYNWKSKQVAEVLDLSPFTVKHHIRAARKKLQQLVA